MASKKDQKGAAAAAKAGALLASAVASTQTGAPFYATKAEMAGLTSHQSGVLVEFNEAAKDPADPNKIAFRATALGVQYAASQSAPQQQPAAQQPWGAPQGAAPNTNPNAGTSAQARTFQFQKGIAIPAARRGGRGQNAYGFEQMAAGDSFFIAATDDNPNPSKRVASTVSSASKRLAPMSFIVRSVEEGNPPVKGARVWRTQ